MSTEHDGKYHGQEYIEGREASDVPTMAGDASVEALDRAPGEQIEEYLRVIITGNYGFACAQQQVLTYHNITLAQARKRKWDYFGVCPSTMTCYNKHNEPVHEE